jgi:hypothetical protein
MQYALYKPFFHKIRNERRIHHLTRRLRRFGMDESEARAILREVFKLGHESGKNEQDAG